MSFDPENSLILDGIFYKVPKLSILKGIYLKAKGGKITGILGRNGSGKSTLLKITSAQISCQAGVVIIDGKRYYKKSQKKRFQKVAYLSQKSFLPKDVKVKYLINSFPRECLKLQSDLVIERMLSSTISDLSGGERRYLEIMLLLSLDRKYFLLDEPFTGLSPLLIDKVNKQLIELATKGKGILITDHYHQYILSIIDEAYLMMNKQCYHLDGESSFRKQLRAYGYTG